MVIRDNVQIAKPQYEEIVNSTYAPRKKGPKMTSVQCKGPRKLLRKMKKV